MHGLVKHLRQRWFLVVLGLVLVLGFVFCRQLEGLAKSAELLNGIVLSVMLLMSLPLGLATFVRSLRRPGASVLAVSMNMLVVPLLAWAASIPLAMVSREMALGLLVAGATPCSLASAAVWTRRAGGNDTIAILVTIVTNLACFVVMPFWLVTTTGQRVTLPFGEMALKLLVIVVAPVVVAQSLRLYRPLAEWATANKAPLSMTAQMGILMMIGLGAASAGAKLEGDFSRLVTWDKAAMVVAVMGVHLAALFLGFGTSLALGHARDDAKAIGIAGSQKTLMVGLHVAIQYFGGLAMLPMIVYHVGQLFADTVVADWMRQRDIKLPPPDVHDPS